MKVKFQTKKESNKEQELHFLSLSPGERFNYWLSLMERSQKLFGNKNHNENKDNFQIVIPERKFK